MFGGFIRYCKRYFVETELNGPMSKWTVRFRVCLACFSVATFVTLSILVRTSTLTTSILLAIRRALPLLPPILLGISLLTVCFALLAIWRVSASPVTKQRPRVKQRSDSAD